MQIKFRPKNPVMIASLAILVIAIGFGGFAFASHSFEAGVAGNNIPQNTQIRLDGLTLPPGGVLPVYDASPNYVSGHFLIRAPCDSTTHVPTVTVIGGHIDEENTRTHMDKMPLFYIGAASTAGSCVYHAHFPDPLNGGSPRTTDMDLINLSGQSISFNPGDAVVVNVQQTLGSINTDDYLGDVQLPGDLTNGNPVFDLNDNDPNNDGLGHQ